MPKYLTRTIVSQIKHDLILALDDETITQRTIAEKYSVDQSTISRIAQGRAWGSVPWPGDFVHEDRTISSGNPPSAPTPGQDVVQDLLKEHEQRVHDTLTNVRESPSPEDNEEIWAREDEDLRNAVSFNEDEEDEDE